MQLFALPKQSYFKVKYLFFPIVKKPVVISYLTVLTAQPFLPLTDHFSIQSRISGFGLNELNL